MKENKKFKISFVIFLIIIIIVGIVITNYYPQSTQPIVPVPVHQYMIG